MTLKIASPTNYAAYQFAPGLPLSIHPSVYSTPGPDQIIIKVAAWGLNAEDQALQSTAPDLWVRYPLLLGTDIAGTVHATGTGVFSFRPGDRVCALAVGTYTSVLAEGAFQLYVVAYESLTARVPSSMRFEEAVVFPQSFATAAAGLFSRDALGLRMPDVPSMQSKLDVQSLQLQSVIRPRKTLVVWGGSSAAGCNAIQLAVAAGYSVIATTSLAYEADLKSLGAETVFDHASPRLVDDVVAAVNALCGSCVGILQASGPVEDCLEVAARANGDIFVATVLSVPENKPADVRAKTILPMSIKDTVVAQAVFQRFLPEALERGQYRIAPQPWTVGAGLEALQDGLQVLRKGVHARKLVISAE